MFAHNREEWLRDIYNKTYSGLYKYAYLKIVNIYHMDASYVADVLQEVYVTVYNEHEKLITHKNIEGWLRVTAKHRMQRMYNDNKKLVFNEDSVTSFVGNDSLADVDINMFIENVLEPAERLLFINRYIYKKTNDEIGKEIGITSDAVKMRLQRIRKKLNEALDLTQT